MKSVREQVEAVRAAAERERAADSEFRRQRDFVEEMRRRGILRKREYDIPPIDTVGRLANPATTDGSQPVR